MDSHIKLPEIGESPFDWISDGVFLSCFEVWHCPFEHQGGGSNAGPVVSTGL